MADPFANITPPLDPYAPTPLPAPTRVAPRPQPRRLTRGEVRKIVTPLAVMRAATITETADRFVLTLRTGRVEVRTRCECVFFPDPDDIGYVHQLGRAVRRALQDAAKAPQVEFERVGESPLFDAIEDAVRAAGAHGRWELRTWDDLVEVRCGRAYFSVHNGRVSEPRMRRYPNTGGGTECYQPTPPVPPEMVAVADAVRAALAGQVAA